MDIITYDLDKLAVNDVINTDMATRFFYTLQEYFDKLTEFTNNYHSYINHYNPTVVVVSEDERNVFIADCSGVRALLMQLGMNMPMNELNNLENAALSGAIKELSDGMIKFHGMLKIAAEHIEKARISPGEPAQRKKILLVHDNADMLRSLASMLDGYYMVTTLLGGLEAVKELDNHAPDMFMIFTEMKGICGYDEKFRHTPIIFLTETKYRSILHEALPFNEMHYIHLPIEKEELLERVITETK
jgi:CheY-like chemotaxis protein